jgi:hypothetical protein
MGCATFQWALTSDIHLRVASSQQECHCRRYTSRLIVAERLLEKKKYHLLTVTEHWDLIARLHAKCGIHIELHARCFVRERSQVWFYKMCCYLSDARDSFHVIDREKMESE